VEHRLAGWRIGVRTPKETTTVTDEDALLRAIGEEPDEDGPRLVYADWLEEHGNPGRAELIRVQCALAALEAKQWGLRQREGNLWDQYELDWLAALEPWLEKRKGDLLGYEFRRGFVEYIQTRLLTDGACRELATQPFLVVLRQLYLNVLNPEDGLTQLLTSSRLANLEGLFVEGGFDWVPPSVLRLDHLKALAHFSHLRRLKHLSLAGHALASEAGEMLASSGILGSLRSLDLTDNRLDDDAALALSRSPHLNQLERLTLWHNPIGPEGAEALRERFGERVVLEEPLQPSPDADEIPF
jgi:uncharacterized protein (TIGR02996 family)